MVEAWLHHVANAVQNTATYLTQILNVSDQPHMIIADGNAEQKPSSDSFAAETRSLDLDALSEESGTAASDSIEAVAIGSFILAPQSTFFGLKMQALCMCNLDSRMLNDVESDTANIYPTVRQIQHTTYFAEQHFMIAWNKATLMFLVPITRNAGWKWKKWKPWLRHWF